MQVGFLPPIALFDEIIEVEGGLFLDGGIHPLDWLASLVEVEGRNPVLANAAVEPHVKAHCPFDFGVDHPVAAFDAQYAPVEQVE